MSPARGRLCVVSGPSGVGKGTVVAEVRRRRPDLQLSVSATTRAQRPGEVDGTHYLFLDDDRFDEMIAGGELLEWAEFAGHRYGTPRAPVDAALADGRTLLLEIEVQGARQIRAADADALLVFLAPPSLEVLDARLRGRATEDDAALERRLRRAAEEMAEQDWFDEVVVNEDVGEAAEAILRILAATPARPRRP